MIYNKTDTYQVLFSLDVNTYIPETHIMYCKKPLLQSMKWYDFTAWIVQKINELNMT